MKRPAVIAILLLSVLFGKTSSAHRIDEYLQATLLSLQPNRIQASIRLIPGVLVAQAVIAQIDRNGDGTLSAAEERTYAQRVLDDQSITIDATTVQPQLLSWSFPPPAQMRDGIGEILIEYSATLPSGGPSRTLVLTNHHVPGRSVYLMNVLVPKDRSMRILAQKRDVRQSRYEVDYQQPSALGSAAPTAASGPGARLGADQFSSLFQLGMRHIAAGTDHLLFLLALLLPAPLRASGARWGPAAGMRRSLRRIFGIVTAFTFGHSITLSLATLNVVHVAQRPVEVLIAISILVSAVHAMRPIFPGKEAWIASCFGLIHGLAFASVLQRLGLAHWQRVAGLFAFNLGIEAMQILVVVTILPSLLLMSSTRAYSAIRSGGAVFAAAASLGWLIERVLDIDIPVDAVVNVVARNGLWVATTGLLLSLGFRFLPRLAHRARVPAARATCPRCAAPTALHCAGRVKAS